MYQTLAQLLKHNRDHFPDQPAQYSKNKEGTFEPTSYGTLYEEVMSFAAGLSTLGVKKNDPVGLVSENRKEWLICDLAVLSLGAADVPRGCDATVQEIQYILSFTESRVTILEDSRQLEKILSVEKDLPDLEYCILMQDADTLPESRFRILGFSEVMKMGKDQPAVVRANIEETILSGKDQDLATIIFTSGTTGIPKGVMLSNRNFLHQVEGVPLLLDLNRNDKWLCVLPVWHSFERIMQYVAMGAASALCYSKPIGKIMLADFQTIHPTWMASVPRIWDSLKTGIYKKINAGSTVSRTLFHFFVSVGARYRNYYNQFHGLLPEFHKKNMLMEKIVSFLPLALLYPLRTLGDVLVFRKIRANLGGNFVAGISGGGALPESVDNFFSAVGILLLEGYGLTESAPVLGVREQKHPVAGTVGPVFPGTVIEIRDEKGNVLPPGHKGLIMAKGPQIMLGYYKNELKTREILSEDGWLNTGDLGMLTWNNELKITGREKDTVVLMGGENIEPAPIEKKLCESDFIEQAVLLGQDQKFLAALIVPVFDQVEQYAREQNLSYMDKTSLLESPEIIDLYKEIISELISSRNGFKSFEKLYRFKLLENSFEVGKELSGKQEVKRHEVNTIYHQEIMELFK